MINIVTSTQVYKQISPIVRNSMTHLFIYRLRNYGDLEATVDKLSAIYDKKHFYKYIMKQLVKIIGSLM